MTLGRDLIIPQTSSSTDDPTIARSVNDYFVKEVTEFKRANAAAWTYVPVQWRWSGNSVYASAVLGREMVKARRALSTPIRWSQRSSSERTGLRSSG